MAQVYYRLIKKGLKTLNDVPEKLREDVEALLYAENNVDVPVKLKATRTKAK